MKINGVLSIILLTLSLNTFAFPIESDIYHYLMDAKYYNTTNLPESLQGYQYAIALRDPSTQSLPWLFNGFNIHEFQYNIYNYHFSPEASNQIGNGEVRGEVSITKAHDQLEDTSSMVYVVTEYYGMPANCKTRQFYLTLNLFASGTD